MKKEGTKPSGSHSSYLKSSPALFFRPSGILPVRLLLLRYLPSSKKKKALSSECFGTLSEIHYGNEKSSTNNSLRLMSVSIDGLIVPLNWLPSRCLLYEEKFSMVSKTVGWMVHHRSSMLELTRQLRCASRPSQVWILRVCCHWDCCSQKHPVIMRRGLPIHFVHNTIHGD